MTEHEIYYNVLKQNVAKNRPRSLENIHVQTKLCLNTN